MPAANPTSTLARFSALQGTLKATSPRMATGILFRDPTRLYVVAVVVERNHRDAKLMLKASRDETTAAAIKVGFCSAGSSRTVYAWQRKQGYRLCIQLGNCYTK
jgi:hypothetical protein